MVLDIIWSRFLEYLNASPEIEEVNRKVIAGLPFIYIESLKPFNTPSGEGLIKEAAAHATKGYQVRSETIFVRSDPPRYIFRHRFYVPDRKMFCCGNLCPDCIRFKTLD